MFIFQGSIIANFLSQNNQQYKIPVYQPSHRFNKNNTEIRQNHSA